MTVYIITYDLDETDQGNYDNISKDLKNMANVTQNGAQYIDVQYSVRIIATNKFTAEEIKDALHEYITGEGSSLFVGELCNDFSSKGLSEKFLALMVHYINQ